MFESIGTCDICRRAAFSRSELGKTCGEAQPDGTECKGKITDGRAPVVLRGEPAAGQATGAAPPSPAGLEARDVFHIKGHDVQYVEAWLRPGETMVAEAGALLYMASGIEWETIFGDAAAEGLLGALVSPIKRALAGESSLLTVFTNRTGQRKRMAFAAPHTGSIIPIELSRYGGEINCQRGAFLCGTAGVTLAPGMHKNISATFVAKEGIIIQKIRGEGVAFLHVGGSVIEYDLQQGEELFVETGAMAAWQSDMVLGIKFHTSLKNLMFANEGIALTHLRGPGRAWIQSLPFNRLARRMVEAAPKENKPS